MIEFGRQVSILRPTAYKAGALPLSYSRVVWSALVDSNHRSSACRAAALAAELRAVHAVWSGEEDSHLRSTAYQTAALAAELPPDLVVARAPRAPRGGPQQDDPA